MIPISVFMSLVLAIRLLKSFDQKCRHQATVSSQEIFMTRNLQPQSNLNGGGIQPLHQTSLRRNLFATKAKRIRNLLLNMIQLRKCL